MTPDTRPDAVAAAQAGDMADALRARGGSATAEELSADVLLPVWNVRRLAGNRPDLFACPAVMLRPRLTDAERLAEPGCVIRLATPEE